MTASHFQAILAEIQAPVLAGSFGAALTLLARNCGFRFRLCRHPQAHHTHNTPIPRIGGVAVFAAIVCAVVLIRPVLGVRSWLSLVPILLASIPVFLVGTFDDLRHASPKTKVLAQIAGTVVLVGSQAMLTQTRTTTLELLLLVPWMVVATNSFNLIDGVDGLAAGTAVMIAAGLSVVNIAEGNFPLALLSATIASACCGFLPFNLFGTRIFLGDSGSLTIGFLLAAIASQTAQRSVFPLCAVLMFGYPLSETALSVFRRGLKGRSLFRPDREHLHHKLRNARFTPIQAAAVLWLVALAFACLGVFEGLGGSRLCALGGALVLFVALAKNFGYLRPRILVMLRRRFNLQRSRADRLPDIAGYVPFK